MYCNEYVVIFSTSLQYIKTSNHCYWLLLPLLSLPNTSSRDVGNILSDGGLMLARRKLACLDKLCFRGVVAHDLYPRQASEASETKLVNF